MDCHGLFPILVHSQKNIGTEYCPRWHRSGLHNLGKLLALGRRQTYLVLLDRHIRIVLSWTQQSYENICFYTTFRCYRILVVGVIEDYHVVHVRALIVSPGEDGLAVKGTED